MPKSFPCCLLLLSLLSRSMSFLAVSHCVLLCFLGLCALALSYSCLVFPLIWLWLGKPKLQPLSRTREAQASTPNPSTKLCFNKARFKLVYCPIYCVCTRVLPLPFLHLPLSHTFPLPSSSLFPSLSHPVTDGLLSL